MKLAPYPEYKDTELNWLESLPDSWNILRTKTGISFKNRKGFR